MTRHTYRFKTDDGRIRCPVCHRIMVFMDKYSDVLICPNVRCSFIFHFEPPKIKLDLNTPYKLTLHRDSIAIYIVEILEYNELPREAEKFYKEYKNCYENSHFFYWQFLKLTRFFCRLKIEDDFEQMAKLHDKRLSKMSQSEIEIDRRKERENMKEDMERQIALLEAYEEMEQIPLGGTDKC